MVEPISPDLAIEELDALEAGIKELNEALATYERNLPGFSALDLTIGVGEELQHKAKEIK